MIRRELGRRLVAGVMEVATTPLGRFATFRRSFRRDGTRGGTAGGDRIEELQILSADGTALHADMYTPRGEPEGTVVLAHGYRNGRGQLAFLAEPLLARGQRVIALDFRGHGRSGGTRVTIGAREADDVRAVLEVARRIEGERGRVAFLGFSMGASAYLLSGVEADVAVLDSPYDTLEGAVSARVRRLGLPDTVTTALAAEGSRQIGVEFASTRPIDNAARLKSPTLFVFALQDPWIDGATRDAFARVLPACAELQVVPGGHRRHFGPSWHAAVVEFLTRRETDQRNSQTA
jgi:pimeloyl-ACP methyl ester carboxylesterase